MALSVWLGIHDTHVLDAVELTGKSIEQPLPIATLARATSISQRQLERLFATHLATTPQHYYLQLRLTHARRLLQQTGMQIIAVACGFTSATPFSRAYRAQFGRATQQDRQVISGRISLRPQLNL